jgi:hypothetical protein
MELETAVGSFEEESNVACGVVMVSIALIEIILNFERLIIGPVLYLPGE